MTYRMTKEEAVARLKDWREVLLSGNRKAALGIAIEALLAAEPKIGKWVRGGIIMDIGDVQVLTCDVCRKTILWVNGYDPNDEEPKFCPNCGADMRGEDGE